MFLIYWKSLEIFLQKSKKTIDVIGYKEYNKKVLSQVDILCNNSLEKNIRRKKTWTMILNKEETK